MNLALEAEDLMGKMEFLREGYDEVRLIDRPPEPIRLCTTVLLRTTVLSTLTGLIKDENKT